jgi:taurine dioxygenase
VDQAAQSFSIKPLSPHTGAEIAGIDLRRPVEAATRAALNRAFEDHAVLAIRNQCLSAPEFLAAMQIFGDVFAQHKPRFAVPECPAIHYISNQDKLEDGRVSTFRARVITPTIPTTPPRPRQPPCTRSNCRKAATIRSSLTCARPLTPCRRRSRRESTVSRRATSTKANTACGKLPQLPGERKAIADTSVIHPLVRTHPVNGRKAIYVNPIRIEEIVSMPDAEALALLDELLAHAMQARFEYRHTWRPGDVVIWDNRCLLHKANGDYPVEQVRYLYRLMLKGERPS